MKLARHVIRDKTPGLALVGVNTFTNRIVLAQHHNNKPLLILSHWLVQSQLTQLSHTEHLFVQLVSQQ